jgi:hypothetical protein
MGNRPEDLSLDKATEEDERRLPRGSKEKAWRIGVASVNNGAFAHKNGRLEPFKASIVALAASLCIAVPTSSGASIETIFDQIASKLEASRDGKKIDNLSGKIAWGVAYELDALLDMYLATGKEGYLAKFVPLCDRVVAARADKMGQLDFKGRLCAGWLTNGHYTQGEPVVLLSAHGQPSIEIQASAHSYNDDTVIQDKPATSAQTRRGTAPPGCPTRSKATTAGITRPSQITMPSASRPSPGLAVWDNSIASLRGAFAAPSWSTTRALAAHSRSICHAHNT